MNINLSRYRAPSRRFFSRDPLVVAKAVIGSYLLHVTPDGRLGGMIVEAEAYTQFNDPGCHAFRGMTNRNRVMFGPAGHAYTYFTYGNHWMFNIVTGPEGEASAVLIRALEPVEGIELMRPRRPKAKTDIDLCNGPGKLAAAMRIGRDQYGVDLISSSLRILIPTPAYRNSIIKNYGGITQTTRIGLTMGCELPYRFYLTEHPCVSVRKKR